MIIETFSIYEYLCFPKKSASSSKKQLLTMRVGYPLTLYFLQSDFSTVQSI